MNNRSVEQFVRQVHGRLNQNLLQSVLIYALTIGAGALVTYGLFYIAQGYAVPRGRLCRGRSWLRWGLGWAVWLYRRVSISQASHYADEHFRIKGRRDVVSKFS